MVYSTTLTYQFPPNFVFKVVNQYLTKINWGDGSEVTITHSPIYYSYHKYTIPSIYKVTFTSTIPIEYTWITYPRATNGYGYIINCPNDVGVNDNIKLHYTFNEQGYASDRIKKIKDQTIYSNLKLTNDLPKKYDSYNSLINIQRGYIYCNFDSVYVFQ